MPPKGLFNLNGSTKLYATRKDTGEEYEVSAEVVQDNISVLKKAFAPEGYAPPKDLSCGPITFDVRLSEEDIKKIYHEVGALSNIRSYYYKCREQYANKRRPLELVCNRKCFDIINHEAHWLYGCNLKRWAKRFHLNIKFYKPLKYNRVKL